MRRRKLSHIVGTIVVLLVLFVSSLSAFPVYQTAGNTSESGLCKASATAGSSTAYSDSPASDVVTAPVPEPATVALLGLGALILVFRQRQ